MPPLHILIPAIILSWIVASVIAAVIIGKAIHLQDTNG